MPIVAFCLNFKNPRISKKIFLVCNFRILVNMKVEALEKVIKYIYLGNI